MSAAARVIYLLGVLVVAARFGRGRRDWHPMEEIVGATLRRLGPRLAGRRLDVALTPDLPLVLMDDVLIDQVLTNLLDNALKAARSSSRCR